MYSSQIAACDRSAGSDAFEWPPSPAYNGWEKAFLRPWPAPSWRRTRAASSGCWLLCGLRAASAFQHLNSRSASLPRRLRSCCSSAPPPPSPTLARAAGRTIRPLCCGIIGLCTLTPSPSVVFAGAQDEGKGEGRRGWHHHRVLRHHLGDARRPLSAPCHAQQAVRPGRCAEKLLVLFLACLVVWLTALCG